MSDKIKQNKNPCILKVDISGHISDFRPDASLPD